MTSPAETEMIREMKMNGKDRKDVMRLCKRNDYYENDVYFHLYGDFPKILKKQLCEANIYDEAIKELHSRIYKEGRVFKGYFICVNGKPVGFIFYQKDEDKTNEILFILVDKEYQKKGYGIKLLNKHDLDCCDNEIVFAKVENKDLLNFYEKSGFIDLGERKGRYIVAVKMNMGMLRKIKEKLEL